VSIDPDYIQKIADNAAAKTDPIPSSSEIVNGGDGIDADLIDGIAEKASKRPSSLEYRISNPEEYNFQLKTGIDNDLYRAERQGFWSEAANAILGGIGKGALTAIEDAGYLLDFENHANTITNASHIESNWLSNWAKDNKEWLDKQLPIYKKDPSKVFDWVDSASYWSALQGVIDSAAGS
jgi:hypothetical protein